MKRMLKNIMMFLAVADMGMACKGKAEQIHGQTAVKAIPAEAKKTALPPDWMEITAGDGFLLLMPYADSSNFTHQKIYDCPRCLLRPEVGQALLAAGKDAVAKGYRIVIYDAYRPMPYQQKMYDVVPDKRYVADPVKGSMHNRGCAVDVGLADTLSNLMDMGTVFDDFSEKATFSFSGLTPEQRKNRALLRKFMTAAGFKPYEKEWWHFNYHNTDYPLSDYIWPCN